MVNENKKSKKHNRNKKKSKANNVEDTEQTDNFSELDHKEVSTEEQHEDSGVDSRKREHTGDSDSVTEYKPKKKKNKPVSEQEDHKEVVWPEEQYENRGEDSGKREHTGDSDSYAEDKPKKKKKRNKPVPEPTGDKKGKKSIRQIKREKHAQRQAEAKAASKDQLKSQCLSYLSQWKHDKQNWKFMKVKQVWLLKNKFSPTLLPETTWPLLLEYFESAQGNIRKNLLEDANKVIQQKDEWLEAQNCKENEKSDEDNDEETENPDGPKKPDETSYKRARDLIQCLQE